MSQQDEYITVKQAAEILEVTPRTVYRYVERGLLTKYQRLFQTKFSRAEVERLAQVQPEERERED